MYLNLWFVCHDWFLAIIIWQSKSVLVIHWYPVESTVSLCSVKESIPLIQHQKVAFFILKCHHFSFCNSLEMGKRQVSINVVKDFFYVALELVIDYLHLPVFKNVSFIILLNLHKSNIYPIVHIRISHKSIFLLADSSITKQRLVGCTHYINFVCYCLSLIIF